MIRYLPYREIDKRKWDACMDASLNGRIYGSSWYLDIVCPQWDAMVEDDYVSVFPLTFNQKFGIKYLYQPYFTQQLGVFSTAETETPRVSEFLSAIPGEFRFAEIHLNEKNKMDAKLFRFHERTNLLLDLSNPYAEIRKDYNQNTKRNLKKAEENRMMISNDLGVAELIALFRNNFGDREGKLTDSNYLVLEKLMHGAMDKGAATLTGIRSAEGILLAGVSMLRDRNRWVFHFAASSQEGKNKGAMFRLVDHLIRERSGSSGILDFEGSEDENMARFYKGFGAADASYPMVRINRLSWLSYRLVILARKLKSG